MTQKHLKGNCKITSIKDNSDQLLLTLQNTVLIPPIYLYNLLFSNFNVILQPNSPVKGSFDKSSYLILFNETGLWV